MRLRCRWLFLFAVIVVVSIGGWFWRRELVHPALPVVDPPSPLLERRVSLAVAKSPFFGVVAQLAREHGLKFVVDQAALQRTGCTGYEPISFTMPDISLRNVLELLPEQVDSQLKLELRTDSIHVTDWVGSPVPPAVMETRLYPLTELMANPHEFNSRALAEVIQNHICSDSWEQVGGSSSLETFPTALLVSATAYEHSEIEMLLRRLSEVDATNFESRGLEPDSAEQHSKRKLEARLNEPITFDFWQTPLSEIVRWLRDDCHVPILIDHRAFEDFGVDEMSPVTVTWRDVSLRSALQWTLRDLELTLVVRHGVLVITTPAGCDDAATTRLYPISDLIAWLDDDTEVFTDLVTESIAPDAEVDFYGGYLVVTDSADVHDKLQSCLDDLRAQAFSHWYPSTPAAVLPDSIARLEQTLGQVSTFEAKDEPLCDVASRLARELNINVILDQLALEEWAIHEHLRITIPSGKESLGEALRAALEARELGYVIRNEMLVLTSLERAEMPITRVYQVADLCEPASREDAVELESLLFNLTASDYWSGAEFHKTLGTLLVVRASPSLHRRIRSILDFTRSWLAAGKPDGFRRPGYDSDTVVSFCNIADVLTTLARQQSNEAKQPAAWFLEAVEPRQPRDDELIRLGAWKPSLESQFVETIGLVSDLPTPRRCCIYRNCLIVVADQTEVAQIDQVVNRLREFLSRQEEPNQIVTLAAITDSSEEALPRDHFYFDVRPVCHQHSSLDTETLAALVLETIEPAAAANQISYSVITTLPGVFIVRRYYDLEGQIRELLHYLAFEFEQPAVIELLNSPGPVEPPVLNFLCDELFRPEAYRRALATRLLREVQDPPTRVVQLLVKQLSDAIELEEEELVQLTLMALAQYGEAAEPALQLVEKIISQTQGLPGFPNTLLAVDVLAACDGKGLPTLRRLLADPAQMPTEILIKVLEGMQDTAQPLTPEILSRIEHEGADRLGAALLEIDPAGARSREVLRMWRNSPDAAVRARALKVGELVHPYIGD